MPKLKVKCILTLVYKLDLKKKNSRNMPQIISGCVSLEQIYHIKLKQKLQVHTSYNYQSKGVISLVVLRADKKQLQTNQTWNCVSKFLYCSQKLGRCEFHCFIKHNRCVCVHAWTQLMLSTIFILKL